MLWQYFKLQNVLKNVTKFTGKRPRLATLLKKRLWHRCFPVNFAKFLRPSFLQNISGRLLLYFDQATQKHVLKTESKNIMSNLLSSSNILPQSAGRPPDTIYP